MKRITILGGMIALVGVFFLGFKSSETIIVNKDPEVITETVEVEALEVRIVKAQEEAKANIESKVDEYRQELLAEVANDVKKTYIAEIESTIVDPQY